MDPGLSYLNMERLWKKSHSSGILLCGMEYLRELGLACMYGDALKMGERLKKALQPLKIIHIERNHKQIVASVA